MDWAQAFKIANTAALICWILLAVLPRYESLLQGLRFGIISVFAVVYAGVVLTTFSSIEGGGFNTLQEVQVLLGSDPGTFAGWIHYLAFDLFVGVWIAEHADRIRLHRLLQIPILLATFMFGPLGLLLFYIASLAKKRFSKKT